MGGGGGGTYRSTSSPFSFSIFVGGWRRRMGVGVVVVVDGRVMFRAWVDFCVW